MKKNNVRFPRETRIAACASYLIGRPLKQIEFKHGVDQSTVVLWVREAGFKLRRPGKMNDHPSIVKADARRIDRYTELFNAMGN